MRWDLRQNLRIYYDPCWYRDPTLPTFVTDIMNETCYKDLYKLHKRLATHVSHLHFLNTCLRKGFIPKGLNISLAPTVKNESPGQPVRKEWNRILLRSSTLLMKVLKKYHRDQVSTLTNTIWRFEKGVQKRDDFRENKRIMMYLITLHKDKLLVRKQNKLASLNTSHGSHTQRRRRKKKKFLIQSQPLTTCTSIKNKVINLSVFLYQRLKAPYSTKACPFVPHLHV